MKETKRTLLKILAGYLVLACLAVLLVNRISYEMQPKYTYKNTKWPTTASINGFYKMKRNSIDVLFLGSSYCVNAFCPQEIYNKYGIRSFNLGSEQQSISLSYYWLKEALRFQHPKAVVIEMKFILPLHPEEPLNMDEGLLRKCIDPMKWSSVKAEAVKDVCRRDDKQSELSYYLPIQRYHSRWSAGLTSDDLDRRIYTDGRLKGWDGTIRNGPTEFNTFKISDREIKNWMDVAPLQKEYLYKIGDLCKENNMHLILTHIPGVDQMTDSLNNECNEMAAEIGASYYNFYEDSMFKKLDLQLPKDNACDHPNVWGAIKLSDFFGDIFANEFGIDSTYDSQYEDTKDIFEQVKKNASLMYTSDFDEYLSLLKDSSYTVFFSISDDGTLLLTNEDMERLKALGIQSDLIGKFQYSWAAVIDPLYGVSESLSGDSSVKLSGAIGEPGGSYSVSSTGLRTGASGSSILINEKEHSRNTRGINIVVWDNYCNTIIDSVTFDTNGDRSSSGPNPNVDTWW